MTRSFALIISAALIAGCGPETTGGTSGNSSGGTSSGGNTDIQAEVSVHVPDGMSGSPVIQVGSVQAVCNNGACTATLNRAGTYSVQTTIENALCADETVRVNQSGAYTVNQNCGLAPVGTYTSLEGGVRDFSTSVVGNNVVMTGFAANPVAVQSNEFYGEVDREVNGEPFHEVISGSISDDLCYITFHKEATGSAPRDSVFYRSDCPRP